MAVSQYSSGHHKRSIFKTHLGTSGGQSECVSSGCSVEFQGGSTLSLESDALFKAAAGSTMDISGSVKVESGARMNLMVGSSANFFGLTRELTSKSNTSFMRLSNHGYSWIAVPSSAKWNPVLAAPTSGVVKTIVVSMTTKKKSLVRLIMGTSLGSKAIGIGSTMRHSITFSSHARNLTTAGAAGASITLLGLSGTRWQVIGYDSSSVTHMSITSATIPA